MAGDVVAWCHSVMLYWVGTDEADIIIGVVFLSFAGFCLWFGFLRPQQGLFGPGSKFEAFSLLAVLSKAGIVAIPTSATPSSSIRACPITFSSCSTTSRSTVSASTAS